ncbi:hypothetical protein D3C73_819860 [compost metagenome]
MGATERAAVAQHPLHAQFSGIGLVDLHDQALHQHLRPTLVELVDHPSQVAVHRLRGRDQQGVGGDVGLHRDAVLAETAAASIDRITTARVKPRRFQRIALALALRRLRRRAGAAAGLARQCGDAVAAAHRRRIALPCHHAPQHPGQLGGLGIAQVHHMQVAGLILGLVQLLHQLPRQACAARAAGAQQHAVAARVGHHHHLLRRLRALRVQQWCDHRRHVHGNTLLQLDHVGVHAGRRIHAGDHPRDALQVVGVVGDDQRVVARVRGDRIVRGDHRPQHRHQRRCALVAECKRACGYLASRAADTNTTAQQLGIGLWHHPADASTFDHGKAAHAQCTQQQLVSLHTADRPIGDNGHLAGHPWVDQELAAGEACRHAQHPTDVGVHQVQLHGFATGVLRLHRRRKMGQAHHQCH